MSDAKACFILDGFLALFLLVLDRITKILAFTYLSAGKSVAIGAFLGVRLEFLLTTNEGAAWGAFAQFPKLLFCVRLIFIAGLIFFYIHNRLSFSVRIAIVAVLSGAIGNIIDSMYLGRVVDMIHIIPWRWDYPVFNLADTWIFLGCVTFLLSSWKKISCE